jgi:outer membrane protein OmpA-like peptidoglycan-associated protein
MIVYIVQDSVYMPLFETLNFFQIYFDYDSKQEIVSGYREISANSYSIDFKRRAYNSSRVGEGKINVGASYNAGAEIYMRASLFAEIFRLELNIDQSRLALYLKSDYKMPFETRLSQSDRTSKLKMKNIGKDEYEKLFTPSFKIIDAGALAYNIGANQYEKYQSYQFRGRLFLNLLGGDLQINNSGYYSGQEAKFRTSETKYFWRYALKKNWLNEIFIGSFYKNPFSGKSIGYIGMNNNEIQGLRIGNKRVKRNFYSESEISDVLAPGWTVDLYKDGELINSATTDSAGRFSFRYPLNFGSNRYEIKCYGPKGQFYSKEYNNQISSEFTEPGKLEYELSGGRDYLKKYLSGDVSLDYGLFDGVSLSSYINYDELKKTPDYAANLLFRIFGSYSMNILASPKNFIGGGLRIGGIDFSFMAKNPYSESSGQRYLRYYQLYGSFSFPFNIPININYRANRQEYYKSASNSINASTYLRFFGLNLQFDYSGSLSEMRDRTQYSHYLNLSNEFNLLSYNQKKFLNNARFRIGAYYDFNLNKPKSAYLSASATVYKDLYLNLSANKDLISGKDQISLGMTWRLDAIDFRANAYANDMKYSSSYQEIAGTTTFNSETKDLQFIGSELSDNCSATLHFFIDKNNNDKHDADEALIDAPQIISSNGGVEKGLNKSMRIARVNINDNSEITIKGNSFKNPLMAAKFNTFAFSVNPNSASNIYIPCYVGGAVEGAIDKSHLSEKDSKYSLTIKLKSKNLGDNYSFQTYTDGSLYFLGVKPGEYTAEVDSMQLALLNAESIPAKLDFEIKSTDDGDSYSNLNFKIEPKTQRLMMLSDMKTPEAPALKGDSLPTVQENIDLSAKNTLSQSSEQTIDSNDSLDNERQTPTNERIEIKSVAKPQDRTFYFSSANSFSLSAEIKNYLDQAANYLKINKATRLVIVGHSDYLGSIEKNQKTSEKRAQAAANYLAIKGIDRKRILVSGKGALYPTSNNSTPEGRAKNRRIEISILEK